MYAKTHPLALILFEHIHRVHSIKHDTLHENHDTDSSQVIFHCPEPQDSTQCAIDTERETIIAL